MSHSCRFGATGTQLLVFAKDDLYLSCPDEGYKTISIAAGFSNAIHASVHPRVSLPMKHRLKPQRALPESADPRWRTCFGVGL